MDLHERFSEIFEKSDTIIDAVNISVSNYNMSYRNVNISTIISKLINEAGRWCINYASDILYDLDKLRETITKHVSTFDNIESDIIVFGFRLNGVDHDAYVNSHIERLERINGEYIRIYAIEIKDSSDTSDTKHVSITLKDITSEVESANYYVRNSLYNHDKENQA